MFIRPLLVMLALGAGIASAAISDLDKKFNTKRGNGKTQQTTKSKTTSNSRGKTKPQPKPAPERASQSSTLLSGLYDGEEIRMPDALLKEVQDINGKLKEVLGEQDYLAILKGELAWYVSKKAQGRKMPYSELKTLLNAILKDPANDRLFRWPRFRSISGEGVHFVKTLGGQQNDPKSNANFIGYSDDRFCFWRTGEEEMSVFDVRTGILSGTISLPCFPMTTILTRIPGSDMYFLSIARYKNVGMYGGVYQTAEAGTWQESGCGFASIVDAEGKRMQTFLFGRYSPGDYYNPRKSALFARSGFPLERYMELKPSRRNFDDSVASAYAFTRSQDEHEVSRPSWGDWKEWMLPNKRTDDAWTPDDLYADKTFRESHLSFLNETPASIAGARKLNFRTLKFETPVSTAAEGEIKDLKAYVLEKLGGAYLFEDGWGQEVKWDSVEAVQAGRHVAFSFTSESFELVRNYSMWNQLAGYITPEGKVYVFTDAKGGVKLTPYNRTSMIADVAGEMPAEVLRTPMSIQVSADGSVSAIWKEARSCNEEGQNAHALIQEVDMGIPKVVSSSTLDRVPEGYDAASGFIMTKVNGNHFRLNKLTDKDLAASGIDYYVSGDRYALVLPDGRYCGTPGCEAMLVYNKDGIGMGLSALAPWRNRPAEVLRALGGSAEDIAALESTTKRWLARKGMGIDDAEPALGDFPQAEVSLPPLTCGNPTCSFLVRLKATKKDLAGYRLEIDGVPRFVDLAAKGIKIPAGRQMVVKVTVPLIPGQNWIKLTPVDADGLEGNSTRFRVIHALDQVKPGTLYVVAMGVSDYVDDGMKLQYAAKDATNVVETFKTVTGGTCKTLLLKDREVNRDVLKKVKKFLAEAKPEDSAVVYLAGHGLLDENMDYYYAPATFNVEDIKGSGLSMKEITGVFNCTLARKRLLLLDTCHSGALGEEGEEKMALAMGQLPSGVRAIQHRGMKVKKVDSQLNANQKKRYIEEMFSMTEAVPGVNVISGAAGAEFAMESGEWDNGVFTAALLEAITNSADADSDKDGIIRLPELAEYVRARVSTLTNGAQQPSVNLTAEAPYFIVGNGLRAYLPKDGNEWTPFVTAMRACRKTDQAFDIIYPDVFGEGGLKGAPESVLSELARLTGGKTKVDGSLLVNACTNFDHDKILYLLGQGADPNSVDYDGSSVVLILVRKLEEAALCGDKAKNDLILDVMDKIVKMNADLFLENERGECAEDHTPNRLQQAVMHAIHHIEVSNSSTPNQLEEELTCYAPFVDFFDKGEVNLETIAADARESAAKFPTRVFSNVRDVYGEWAGLSKDRYSYHISLTCDCDYVGHKGKKLHMVMCNHYLISFVKGKPRITAIRTIVNPQNDKGNKELDILMDTWAEYECANPAFKRDSYDVGLLKFYKQGQAYTQAKDENGRTMLHYACAQGRALLCKWLLQHGADPDAKDKYGKKPEDYIPALNLRLIPQMIEDSRKQR